MASRELVVAIFADAGPFEREMLRAAQVNARSMKVITYDVGEMSRKNIVAMTAVMAKTKEMALEYSAAMATMKTGSLEYTATQSLLTAANRRLGIETRTTSKLVGELGKKATAVGRSFSTYLTLPIVLAGAAATKMFIQFQQRMEMIHTQAGASQAEVNKQSKAVLEFAKKGSPLDQSELSKGLFFIESRGLRGAKALDAMKVSAEAAGLGMASMEEVANALGGAIITNIKGTQDYTQAMGIINATVGGGAMHMADYAAALRTGVVPAAKAAGIGLDEIGAALDVLTDRGMPAQMAATRLRMTFAMMQKPTRDGARALGELGISGDQLATTLRQPDGLQKALELLQAGIDRMGGSTKAYGDILQAFGKGRSSAGILTLLNSLSSTTASFKIKIDQIRKQQGSFAKDVAAYHETAAYKISAAWNSIKANMTAAGASIAPIVVKIAKGIAGLVTAFSHLPKPLKDAMGIFVLFVAAIGPVLFLGGKLITMFTGIGTVIRTVGLLGRVMFTGMSAEAVATAGVIDSALISTGIGALVVAVGIATVYIITHWEKVKKWIRDFANWMKSHSALLFLVPVIGPMLFMTAKVIQYWDKIKKAVEIVGSGIKKIWDSTIGYVMRLLSRFVSWCEDKFGRLFKWIYDKFTGIFKKVGGWLSSVGGWLHLGAIGSAFENFFWNTGKSSGENFVSGFSESLSNLPNVASGSTTSVLAMPVTGAGAVGYQAMASAAAKQYGIPEALFLRQINQESGFNPNARSGAGALGIAQFMPGTAAGYHIDPMDPKQALPASAKMMKGLFNKYHDWGLALAAYNAGEGAVDRYRAGLQGLPKETTDYVKIITGAPIGQRSKFSGTASAKHSTYDMSSLLGASVPYDAAKTTKTVSGVHLLSAALQKLIAVATGAAAKGTLAAPAYGSKATHVGNMDLYHRPLVHNKDGSYSTVRSISVGIGGGKYALIPTAVGGKVLSNQAAIASYHQTGKNLGVFSSEAAANAYAKRLHAQQETLMNEKLLMAAERQGITYLDQHYKGAKKTAAVEKERAALVKSVERIQNQIDAAASKAAKQRLIEQKHINAEIKKAHQEAEGRAERGILGIAGTNKDAPLNSFKNSTKQSLKAINDEFAKWGVSLPASAKRSIALINKILKYDFIPSDVRENLKARLRQLKETADTETQKIIDGLKAKADALKTMAVRVFAAVNSAADTVFNEQTSATLQTMTDAMNAQLTAMNESMDSHVQDMQDAADKKVKDLQITVHSSAGSFQYGGSIDETPAEKRLKALQHAQQQNNATLALLNAQSSGDTQAINEALLQQQINDASDQADIERKAADDQYSAAQAAYKKQLDLQITEYQKQEQAKIDAYQRSAETDQAAYQTRRDAQQAEMDLELSDLLTKLEDGQINYQTYRDGVKRILGENQINSETISIATGQGLVNGITPGINAAIDLWNAYAIAMKKALAGETSDHVVAPHLQPKPTGFGIGAVPFATGGIVTRPMLGLVGESGPEAIIPLSRMGAFGVGSGEAHLHIHFDGPVIGTDLRKAARDLAPAIRAEIVRAQQRNVTSGIV